LRIVIPVHVIGTPVRPYGASPIALRRLAFCELRSTSWLLDPNTTGMVDPAESRRTHSTSSPRCRCRDALVCVKIGVVARRRRCCLVLETVK